MTPRYRCRGRVNSYVPVGSIKKGEAFVKTGGSGKSVACAICHGDSLQGLGNVARLAGLQGCILHILRASYTSSRTVRGTAEMRR